MTSWATSLPGEILVRLRKALRGTEGIVTDGDFYAALTDELWERAGEDVAVASDDGAGGWPTRVVRHRCSSRRESPRYLVCPSAETVDTLDHAPAKILDRLHWCICGCTYVRPGVDSLYRAGKFLDAF